MNVPEYVIFKEIRVTSNSTAESIQGGSNESNLFFYFPVVALIIFVVYSAFNVN